MATSTCAKCGGHSFERALLTPIGEDRKLAIVQCATCGTVIGALDPASSIQHRHVNYSVVRQLDLQLPGAADATPGVE